MKDRTAEELIALAGAISISISECLDTEELFTLLEFLGLLRHDLEVIKARRILRKIEKSKNV